METGRFSGFEVTLEDPGIAWIRFNTPERMNGMTTAIKRISSKRSRRHMMDNNVRVSCSRARTRVLRGDDLKAYRDAELADARSWGRYRRDDTRWDLQRAARRLAELNAAIRDLDKLTIAAVNGIAIQTGSRSRSPATSEWRRGAPVSAARRCVSGCCPTRAGNTCSCR